MASEIIPTIERLSREKEELESREDSHHADVGDRDRLREVENAYRSSGTSDAGRCPASARDWTRTSSTATA